MYICKYLCNYVCLHVGMHVCVYEQLYMYVHVYMQVCVYVSMHVFIHSGHFNSAPSSPLLLRGVPDYRTDTVSEFHAKAQRQL